MSAAAGVQRAIDVQAAGLYAFAAVLATASLLVGGAGAVLALGLAVALSPVAPAGLARQAEIDAGLAFDGAVLARLLSGAGGIDFIEGDVGPPVVEGRGPRAGDEVAAANLLAAVPARAAARVRPAMALRAE